MEMFPARIVSFSDKNLDIVCPDITIRSRQVLHATSPCYSIPLVSTYLRVVAILFDFLNSVPTYAFSSCSAFLACDSISCAFATS